jgi:hypothetical protein
VIILVAGLIIAGRLIHDLAAASLAFCATVLQEICMLLTFIALIAAIVAVAPWSNSSLVFNSSFGSIGSSFNGARAFRLGALIAVVLIERHTDGMLVPVAIIAFLTGLSCKRD